MSIQRTGYQIKVEANAEETDGTVFSTVQFKGRYEDKEDALLMILDGWDDAMKIQGFDPMKSHMRFQSQGKLQ